MAFDPITTPTVPVAEHLEPAFQFPEQATVAQQKLAARQSAA